MACTAAAAAAVTSAERAYTSSLAAPSRLVGSPSSSPKSSAPNINAATRGLAVAMAKALSSPRGLSMATM